jgi:4-hydroxybenzoate polyprenyltransferase
MGSEPPSLRTLLVLGRVSNLPTVWTNCLAGWLLGGGGPLLRLVILLAGGSLLYVGGMYLNDAFDAGFDRRLRRGRPIPNHRISEALVWRIGIGLLAAGAFSLIMINRSAAACAVSLTGFIVLYNAVHKAVAFSPILMALCRFFLFLAAAAASQDGITGLALWSAFALAGWVVGLSYVARRESTRGPIAVWPLAALSLPLILAVLVDDGPWRWRGIVYALLWLGWTVWCLQFCFQQANRNLQRTVSGLLAGICLVDLLALGPGPLLAAVFIACFAGALLAQRFIPAT